MSTNDETIYRPKMVQDGKEKEETKEPIEVNEANEPNEPKVSPKSENQNNGWLKVTIGGVAGIFMGAGGMYAGKPYADDLIAEAKDALADLAEEYDIEIPGVYPGVAQTNPIIADGSKPVEQELTGTNETEDLDPQPESISQPSEEHFAQHKSPSVFVPSIGSELRVADVDQSQSFGEAFAQAREAVGPGGVFHWHGGVFNTYTEAEWDSLSASDQSTFAHHIAPEIHQTEATENIVYDDTISTEEVTVVDEDESQVTVHTESEEDVQNPQVEVHVVGMERLEKENGGYMNVGYLKVNEEDVAVVDIDDDNVYDVRLQDLNGDGSINAEEGEVVDISDAELTVNDLAAAALEEENTMDDQGQLANAGMQQEDIAQDMPDYQNYAELS